MVDRAAYMRAIIQPLYEWGAMVCSQNDTIWAEYTLRPDGKVDFETDDYVVTLSVTDLAELLWHDTERLR